jgi:D-arabinose 1-dehydrogenase-like Zn-dependent alcohol dehydrogenase
LVVPEYTLYNCPDNVGLDLAALVEPLAVGWHAVNSSPFKPSDTALILGGGPIGQYQSTCKLLLSIVLADYYLQVLLWCKRFGHADANRSLLVKSPG